MVKVYFVFFFFEKDGIHDRVVFVVLTCFFFFFFSLSLSLSLSVLFFFFSLSLSLSLSLGFCPSTMCICIVVFPYFRSIALTTRFFFVRPPNTSRFRTLSRETAGALEFSTPATP